MQSKSSFVSGMSRVRVPWIAIFALQFLLLCVLPCARAQSQCPAIASTCGDGIITDGEQCDDGNMKSADGCNATCGNECGFSCTSTWAPNCPADQDDSTYWGFKNSSCVPLFGDGKRVLGEECDDGNLDAGDGCLCSLKTRTDEGGCHVESERWVCIEVADLAITCQSRTKLADRCLCATTESQVELPAQPLRGISQRSVATVSGFAGAAGGINCGSCACHHYGGCGAENFCTWDGTCSGNGFCDGEGKCVCFGNFTGPNCNRCKKDHYGASCARYCRFDETCGGHGYCDFEGNCAWNPFCEGVDLAANECGDGRRLGAEACDDNNTVGGDGCSASCTVEPGFVCTGGCQQGGDVRRLYGECGRDTCSPVPCGWVEMRSTGGVTAGVLGVRQPGFVVRSIAHDNPTLAAQNTLTITLAPTVPLQPCVNRTEVAVVAEEAWLKAEREVTWCEQTVITIAGLDGANRPQGAEPEPSGEYLLPLWDGNFAVGTVPSDRYGWGGEPGVALWDNVAKTLQFTLVRTQFEEEPVVVQVQVQNAERVQESPEMVVGCGQGLVMADQAMERQLGAFQFDGVGSQPLALQSLLGRRLWRSAMRGGGRGEEGAGGARRGLLQAGNSSEGACPGGGGAERVCAVAVEEALPYAGADTEVRVRVQASLFLPAGSDIYLDRFLPPRERILFAVTSSSQCAQNLPYGPDDAMLYRSELGQPAQAYLSTANRDVLHSAWVQELYDGLELKMSIFWSFLAEPKTLKQRFRSAAEGRSEAVVWTVRDGQGVHRGTKRGVYRFSSKLAGVEEEFGVDGVFEGEGPRFSVDDGVWGGGTGEVDGAIDEVYGGILDDFWGHGNFNQQEDASCREDACCAVYFTGGLSTAVRSNLITSKMHLLNCSACQCIGEQGCARDAEIDPEHAHVLDTCGVRCADRSYTCGHSERWFESFDGAVGLTVEEPGVAAGGVVEAQLRVTNPQTRVELAPVARVRVEGRATDLVSEVAVEGGSAGAGAALGAGRFVVKGVGQSSPVPGAVNTLTLTLVPSAPQPSGAVLTVAGLLPVPALFAVTTQLGCSANLLPFGPEGPQNQQGTPYLSVGAGTSNWAHSFWRQEVFMDGEHKFTSIWRFLAPKTLRARLEDAAAEGEPVVWTVTPRGANAESYNASVLSGVWRPAIPDLDAGAGAWSSTSVWGGASGAVGGEVLGSDFWGHADTAEASTNCQQLYMNGQVLRPRFSLRSELYLEDTPLLAHTGDVLPSSPPGILQVGDFASTGVGQYGVEGRLGLELVEGGAGLLGGDEAVVNLTVMNRLANRPAADAVVEVGGCNPIAREALDPAPGLGAPLLIVPPEFLVLEMGQANPFPAALNVISVTLMLNLGATVFGQHRLEFANLANARRESGPVALRDPSGAAAHLLFAAEPRGAPGQALWAEAEGLLTLFLVAGPGGGSLEANVAYHLEVDLENPAQGQEAPDVLVTAHIGRRVEAVAAKDLRTDLSPAIKGAVPGDAAALRVISARWAEGTRISQTSPYPGARNEIKVALNINVALRSASRSYDALVITIAGLEGASIVTEPESTPLINSPRPSSVADSRSYFADGAGVERRGRWVQEAAAMELALAGDTAALAIYSLAFVVTNPVTGQASPDVRISSSGVEVLDVDLGLCEEGACAMPKINTPDLQPLFVEHARFINKTMGQSTWYPAALNTLTVTLGVNVPIPALVDTLPDGVSVVLSNLAGAVAGPGGVGTSTLVVYGRPLDGAAGLDGSRSEEHFSTSYQGASGSGQWDNEAKELRMWVVEDLPAFTLLKLSFELTNPVIGQVSPDVAVAGLGIPIEATFVDKEMLQPLGGLPGDAAPLRVYEAQYLVKSIGQTNPYPGAHNSIRVTLRMSVDLPASSHPDLYTSWQWRISGLFGGPSEVADYPLTDPTNTGSHLAFASSSDASCAGCVGQAHWDGRVSVDSLAIDDNKAAVLYVREGIERERDYTLSISFTNPATPQQSPVVFIRTEGLGALGSRVEMDRDELTELTDICPYRQCQGQPGDAMPLRVIEPRFLVKKIEQSNPFPGADNTISVTIALNVPLFPLARNCSSIGFATAMRELGSLEPGVGSTLCVGGLLEGSGCSVDAQCDDQVSEAPTCALGSCDADRSSPTNVVLLGLTGPLTPRGPLDILDASGGGGHLFFAASGGGAAGQGFWEQDVGVLTLVVAEATEPVVNYSFSFTTTNPIAAQESPPVSIALAGALSTDPVPMNRSVGDGAPVKVLPVRFLFSRISQSNPYPFAVNTIHVTLATNLPLTPSTKLTLYPFKDATMDADVPGFSASGQTVALTDPRGQGGELFFGGSAVWQGANKAVVLSLVTTAPQETNISVSFNLRNPGSAQQSTRMWVAFSLEGSSFQATELERDDTTVLAPAVPEAVPGDASPILVYAPYWLVSTIGQRTAYPNRRNTLTVTLRPAYPIPPRARATVTISGLLGAIAPEGLLELLAADGSPCSAAGAGAGPECSRFAAALSASGGGESVGFGRWDPVLKSVALALPEGLPAGEASLLSLEVLNPPLAQSEPLVLLELGGAAPSPRGPMDHDLTSDLGNPNDAAVGGCESGRWLFMGAEGDAAALRVFQGSFLCFGEGCGGGQGSICLEGALCGGRIGQLSAFPGAVNTLTVTFASNVPLSAEPESEVVISGLLNAINEGGGGDSIEVVSEVAGSAAGSAECLPSAPPLRFAPAEGGAEGRARWVETAVEGGVAVALALHLLEPSVPNTLYRLSFTVRNPIPPQHSPDTFIEVLGTPIARTPLIPAALLAAPMLVVIPEFFVREIRQETAIPSAENTMSVELASNTPLYVGACITLTGFTGARRIATQGELLPGGKYILPLSGPNATLFSWEEGGVPGFGLWDESSEAASLRLTLLNATAEGEAYAFSFRVTNPALQQPAQPVRVEAACGVIIDPALFRTGGITQYQPMRVLAMTIQVRDIGQSNNYPGAVNFITVTLAMNLDLSTALEVVLTMSGLKNSLTESTGMLGLHCQHTGCCGDRRLSSLCLAEGCCRDMHGTSGEMCKMSDERPLCGEETAPALGVCATNVFGERGDPGDPTGYATGQWDQEEGTLKVAAVQKLTGNQRYSFSFTLVNPLLDQPSPSVMIEASSSGNEFIAPIQMNADPAAPPFQVAPPSLLLAKAAQSSPFPCSSNVISVTLALNIPLMPDIFAPMEDGPLQPLIHSGLTLSGFTGATCPSCRAGITCETSCEVPLLSSPSNFKGEDAFTATFDTSTEELTLLVRPSTDLPEGRETFVSAGEPFEVRFELINSKEGQQPSQLGVVPVRVNDWLHEPGELLDMKPLQTIQVKNCTNVSAIDEQPMLVHTPRFLSTKIAQSTPFPLHHNLITVTVSTNVPLRVRCLPVITLSGFHGASGALVDLREPGPAGTQWRSDSCPSPDREALRVAATLEGRAVDGTFGYTGPDSGVRWSRGRKGVSGVTCFNQGGLVDCQNREMCFGLEGGTIGLEGSVEEWRAEEGVMTWFRGQQDRSPLYSRPGEMPGLGDGSCDAAWNCAEYAFDEGDCGGAAVSELPEHRGTVAWDQGAQQVVAHVLNDTEYGKDYVLSFQLTNAATLQHSADMFVELSGIRIEPVALELPEAFRAVCNTGGVEAGEDANPLNVYSASLLTYDISQSTDLPGVQNTFTVVLRTNVHIHPRAQQFITIIGLKGASGISGLLELSSPSASHSFFQPAVGGPRGFGQWDNSAKELSILISSDLLPAVSYSFSFTLTNPPTGQAPPTILLGAADPVCPPSARPLSTRVPVRLKTSAVVGANGQFPPLDGKLPTMTLTSFEDGTELVECAPTVLEELGLATGNATELWLPGGKWYVSLSLQGDSREDVSYFPETLEFDSMLSRLDDGAAAMDFVQGSSCGSIEERTFFQTCTWQPRLPGGLDIVLHPRQVDVTRLVLTWGDYPRDLDLYVTFTSGSFEPYQPEVSCPAGRVIRGGGVWYGCRDWIQWPPGIDTPPAREALALSRAFERLPRVQLERRDDRGGRMGGEVVTLRNVDDAVVQVYVNSPSGEGFAGLEQLRVLFPLREGEDPRSPREPSESRVWTSVFSSVAGTWWHVGVLRMGSSANFQVLNYDKLFADPLSYVYGFKLNLHVSCRSGRDGSVLRGVNYQLTYNKDQSTVLQGIVPDAVLTFPSPNYNVSGTISIMDFTISLEVDGFAPRSVLVRYNASDSMAVDIFMVPQDEVIRIFLSWGSPIADADLWVFPCTDSGSWSVQNAATSCPDGPVLDAGALFDGCAEYGGTAGRSLVHQTGTGGGLHIVQLAAGAGFSTSGTYDIFVHIPADADASSAAGTVNVEVIAMQGLEYVVEQSVSTTVVVDAAGGGKWWHVGYILLDGTPMPQIYTLDFFGSSPTGSGCRIPSRSVPMVTRTFDPAFTTVVDLTSGVSLLIPPNEWPPDVPPTVTVMQLQLLPAAAGPGMRNTGASIYLEPSGVQFLGVGARIEIPRRIIAGAAEEQVLHRLENGVWVPVRPSSVVGTVVQASTPRFSAYAPFILSVPAPPPPPPAVINRTDDDDEVTDDDSGNNVLVLALVAAFACLFIAVIVAALVWYKVRNGRWPWQKKPMKETPAENLPIKSKEVNDMRMTIYKQEVASRQKHAGEKEMNDVALDIGRELEEAQEQAGETREQAALVPAVSAAQRDLVEKSLRAHSGSSVPRIANGSSTQPPDAISQLVRTGVLVPNRASVRGSHGVDGEGAPSKLEVGGRLVEANIMQTQQTSNGGPSGRPVSQVSGGDVQDELEPEWQAPDPGSMGPTTLTMTSVAKRHAMPDTMDEAAGAGGAGDGDLGWGTATGIPFLMSMHKSVESLLTGAQSTPANGNGANGNGAARGQASMGNRDGSARRKPRASGPSASFA